MAQKPKSVAGEVSPANFSRAEKRAGAPASLTNL